MKRRPSRRGRRSARLLISVVRSAGRRESSVAAAAARAGRGNNGSPGSLVCNNNSVAGADNCAAEGGLWFPDLVTREVIWGAGVMVKF